MTEKSEPPAGKQLPAGGAEGVAEGARTLDLQSHNLALYPTEL